MVDPDPPRAPWSVAEALVTSAILINISVILTGHFWTICDSGAVLTPDKRSGRGICYLLVHILSEVDHIPSLERVSLIEDDQGRTVHLLHCAPFALCCKYITLLALEESSRPTDRLCHARGRGRYPGRIIVAWPDGG